MLLLAFPISVFAFVLLVPFAHPACFSFLVILVMYLRRLLIRVKVETLPMVFACVKVHP